MTNLLFKLGLAKTAAQANMVMLVIMIISLGITVYLFLPERAPAPLPQATDNNILVAPDIP